MGTQAGQGVEDETRRIAERALEGTGLPSTERSTDVARGTADEALDRVGLPSSAEIADPDELPASFLEWQQVGQQALRLGRGPVLKTLQEALDECEALIVHEHWLAHDRNLTRASEALGISRKRARDALKAWRQAHGSEGEERDECRP
jgi:DNA-binding NtrC family response regulator